MTSLDTCTAFDPETCAGTAAGDHCTRLADLVADLTSTRVCPAVYRRALDQGRVPPPPPLLRAWCDRAAREEAAPSMLRRIALAPATLGRALAVALRLQARGAET